MNLKKVFNKKTVFVIGHTGFKGSWITLWLTTLGAKVIGLSINIPTKPSHYKSLKLNKKIYEKKIDIRDLNLLKKMFKKHQPDFVFHLAAQSLVKKSYLDPVYTWETNTIGTLNVLESLRELKKKCIAILITSDKSYRNLEIQRGYKEDDILGGKDPYSASKACADLTISSYVDSFFKIKKTRVFVGVARAGNVIGGGDWSDNRLIPDCVKAWSRQKKVLIRNPNSTRPWQHVFEVVWGYLLFAAKLEKNKKLHGHVFNFGPKNKNNFRVISVIKSIKKVWKNISWKILKEDKNFHESNLLKLNSSKAKNILKWKSILSFEETTKLVAEWYKFYYNNGTNIYHFSLSQIKKYEKLINERSIR